MNIFITSDYEPSIIDFFLENYLDTLTPNDTIMTTNREKDCIFRRYALINGIDLKVYNVNDFTPEHNFESISRKVDELIMFTETVSQHYGQMYKYCCDQVILDQNERMSFSDYKSLTEEMFHNKCEKFRSRKKIFNYHNDYMKEVVDVLESVKRVKITIKEMGWYSV